MKLKDNIQSNDQIGNPAILGTFTGKCCDSNVFNNNDMHLSREVFETLMASDEYKRAMENRHYIGFLSHPDDSDCQDDKNACIVMTDMRILDNGEIEGDFDLVNTPVGQIVKTFIDAGVKYGISIRGLGDVDGNGEVDPDGFIFRGFDLVRFPAYDDCIPEFKEIAASTDVKKRAQYKKICASIDANLQKINSCETLRVIQEQLPAESDEFKKIEDRIAELVTEPVAEVAVDTVDDAATIQEVTEQKLEAVTDLYVDSVARIHELEAALAEAQSAKHELTIECTSLKHSKAKLDRIVSNQIADASNSVEIYKDKYDRAVKRLNKVNASLQLSREQVQDLRSSLLEANTKYTQQVTANKQLSSKLDSIDEERSLDKKEIIASKQLNLKYEHKIEANSEAISQKDSQIEDLKTQLNETVVANEKLKSKASNLDEKNKELLSRVEAAEEMVSSYQQAYANMYANALGTYLTGLSISASTSVEELTEMIKAGTSTANIAPNPDFYVEDEDDNYDEFVNDDSLNEMVTL